MAISLSKNQTISLEKSGSGLTRVKMGLGWDPVKSGGFLSKLFGGGGSVDLDASCLMFDSNKAVLDSIYFGQLRSRDGAVQHTGDNLTGEGEGDDESIIVQLDQLPAQVQTLVFTVNSFSGQNFNSIESAYCRLLDETSGAEMARFNLAEKGNHTGVIMALVQRTGSGWSMTAIGRSCGGRTVKDLVPDAAACIPA
jgi:tellurium resistance protein TerZ